MSTSTQSNKSLVWEFWQALDGASDDALSDVLAAYMVKDAEWHGFFPIADQTSHEGIEHAYWQPLRRAVPNLRRKTDLFYGGVSNDEAWVCGAGYFVGTFQHPWLGISATNAEVYIRFGEFHRLEAGKIVATYCLLDVLDVMRQSNIDPLPESRGRIGIVPPPAAKDGILLDPQDDAESFKSAQLVKDMLFAGLNQYNQADMESMSKTIYWDESMKWYGPHGIGSSHDMKEFEDFHQIPFLTGFPDRQATPHTAIFGDGRYAAALGYPGVIGSHLGEYLGAAPTGNTIHMNLMDFWNREGDLLVENWVLIDLIDMFRQFGIQLLPTHTDG